MRRLVITFLLVAFVPIVIVASLAFRFFGEALQEDAFNQLSAVREIKRSEILNDLKRRLDDAEVLSESEDVRRAFSLLVPYGSTGQADPQGFYDVASKEYEAIYEWIDPFFAKYAKLREYHDIFLISRDHGHIMYSVAYKQDLGTNLRMGPYRDSSLAKLWAKVLRGKKTSLVDFTYYAPKNEPAAFVATPITDENGKLLGVLALQISTDQINSIMQERTGMGETGETYLVGEDLLMRSDSRFDSTSTILKITVNTGPVRKALKGLTGTEIAENYRNVKTLSSFSGLGLKKTFGTDFEWIIVSTIDEAEALAPIKALRSRILLIGFAMMMLACAVGYFSARLISKPLEILSERVARMAAGDLTVAVNPETRLDEVGVLMRAFHTMLQTLRNQTQQMMDGARTLAASMSDMSATSAQLAASSAETSTSIGEITTTVEEVRHTAHVSNDKAEQLAATAEKAAQASEVGKEATEQAIEGMNRIKEEMEYVADSIMKLGEQSQSIGEIIGAVNDLADQSNLLSVNASIEAAKAGEYGKGFAVVAQEMKALAEQSKEATRQVRTILNDIQKATSAAVLATERGSNAVEAGAEMSTQSSAAITTLSSGISAAADASVQIAASSQQQLVGMDQLATGMESIKEATVQNLDGAQQLERAMKDLDELAQKLKQLSERFKA